MEKFKSKAWWSQVAERAIKTFAQTFIGAAGVLTIASEINWEYALSMAGVAAVFSVVTSVATVGEGE